MNTPIHKRGDTFSIVGRYLEESVPIDLTNYRIECRIKHQHLGGDLVAVLDTNDGSIQITDAVQGYYAAAIQDTQSWPIGYMLLDIQYTEPGGARRSTETSKFIVVEDV